MTEVLQSPDPAVKARILVDALPYIRRFWGQVVVVKYGGNALAGTASADGPVPVVSPLASFAEDIVLMRSVGMNPLVVHGGGPQIGELLRRLGIESRFVDGLRVTDADTLDVARMVLVGKVNRELVAAINVHGRLAVGVSGTDVGGSGEFVIAVREVMSDLAYACVSDGEGATRVIRVRVRGAVSEAEAREAAREIASSDLLRSAVWGNDPNLGRIVQALGQAPVTVEPDKVRVAMAGVPLSEGGRETGRRPEAAEALAAGGDALIEADLGLGGASFEFLSCDLTPEYVTFNAEYTT